VKLALVHGAIRDCYANALRVAETGVGLARLVLFTPAVLHAAGAVAGT
jgi:hypothetical protein